MLYVAGVHELPNVTKASGWLQPDFEVGVGVYRQEVLSTDARHPATPQPRFKATLTNQPRKNYRCPGLEPRTAAGLTFPFRRSLCLRQCHVVDILPRPGDSGLGNGNAYQQNDHLSDDCGNDLWNRGDVLAKACRRTDRWHHSRGIGLRDRVAGNSSHSR